MADLLARDGAPRASGQTPSPGFTQVTVPSSSGRCLGRMERLLGVKAGDRRTKRVGHRRWSRSDSQVVEAPCSATPSVAALFNRARDSSASRSR